MIKKEKIEQLLKFLAGYLLTNIYWWLPLLVLSCTRSAEFVVIFFSFFVSLIYYAWKKQTRPKKLRIFQARWYIEAGYFLSTSTFLFLTGKFVYDGLMNNFVTHPDKEGTYILLYASAITLCLATITYMIKTGRHALKLALLFLLFDIPGAMPFNFLHFYENEKIQGRLDKDKKIVDQLQLQCSEVINPIRVKYQNDVSSFAKKEQIKQNTLDYQLRFNDRLTQSAVNRLKAAQSLDERDQEAVREIIKNKTSGLRFSGLAVDEAAIKTEADNESALGIYNTLHLQLDTVASLIKNLKTTGDREKQLVIVERIKTLLSNVCSQSSDPELKSAAAQLVPNEPTQLQSISAVYSYIGEEIFGVKPGEARDGETSRLILMSLVPSFIIDILPLIFAMAYARWRGDAYE
ncbi:MAG TPA: hypothetical protein VFE53_03230 [Mucilaginibacter sp.]|nr:hypothetical protein [Mucilaginibacter sp.]